MLLAVSTFSCLDAISKVPFSPLPGSRHRLDVEPHLPTALSRMPLAESASIAFMAPLMIAIYQMMTRRLAGTPPR
jgi:hypothetical protein